MRILISNDDGIFSEGIKIVATWAKKLGEVTVVAPKKEQSGKSQSIEFTYPFECKQIDYIEGVEAYTVDSTPADCIRYAVAGLQKEFDLVISGCNKGYNLSTDILYSGTAGAASEGVTFGIKALAFSTYYFTFEQVTEKLLDKIYEFITENKMFEKTDLINVNIPPEPIAIKVTKTAGKYYKEYFIPMERNFHLQQADFTPIMSDDEDVDVYAVNHNIVSVCPLTIVRTDLVAYEKMKKLTKKL